MPRGRPKGSKNRPKRVRCLIQATKQCKGRKRKQFNACKSKKGKACNRRKRVSNRPKRVCNKPKRASRKKSIMKKANKWITFVKKNFNDSYKSQVEGTRKERFGGAMRDLSNIYNQYERVD